MKNILLITSLYPSDDIKILNNTSVCHYFAKEWVQIGYDVRVVYCYRLYPWYYYPVLRLLRKYLAKTQSTAVLDKKLDKRYDYVLDDVKVSRLPIKITKPHGKFKSKVIENYCQHIFTLLDGEGFVPDIILGHFISPALDIVTKLKSYYSVAQTAVSLHGKGNKDVFDKSINDRLDRLDYIGYRSHSIRRAYESKYGKRPYLMCPSGVPEEYIVDEPHKFTNGIKNFIYVGSFMDRKHPATVVEALSDSFGDREYSITFVGNGAGKKNIIKTAVRCGNIDKIHFTGRIPREDVAKEMDKADVFIMVSEDETFGLVYLEAMSRGCIVIASSDEGMDGYIVDGENGFLCKAGDREDLAKTISKILNYNSSQLNAISSASLLTVRKMTDRKVAEDYIKTFE